VCLNASNEYLRSCEGLPLLYSRVTQLLLDGHSAKSTWKYIDNVSLSQGGWEGEENCRKKD